MFGQRNVTQQVVSLSDLAQFIQQIAPQGQQPQTSITITIYGDLHIHQAGSGYQQLPAGQGRMALPAPGAVAWPDQQEDAGVSLDYLDRALGALATRGR